ncbi:dihydrodipicolinate synthase [Penicillium longicatenatum]|uniref:dihydrodipicolinate synthase n=1 Tax=Penicillium longicatenatum TaxID=1561947 RepID=UPI002548BA6C|nr:dihydrodipicolinate synthase [Penicillium longicatenatum]KAJ5636379.1 dihydrodipicolinate synthase [Penicillium longicatenatum]
MPPTSFYGILVALITPFTPNQSCIDASALHSHIDTLITAGIHGLVPAGSTGEFTTLSRPERKELLDLCIKFAAGRVPVIAGIGSTSTDEAVELAAHAGQAGAAALMAVPPFYDPLNYTQLREFLAAIYEASGSSSSSRLPIIYYHIPSASGVTLSPSQIASLSDVGVKYVKDTSGNAPAYTELIFGLSDKITTFNGWDTLMFYGLAAGAPGAVWGAANFIPELAVELWEAMAVEKNLDKGRKLWSKIWPICKFLETHNYAAAVKTGVELRGLRTGGLRRPFALLEGGLIDELAALMENAGVSVVRQA